MTDSDIVQDPTAPTERRIDALLAEMTLEEKAAQLSGVPPKQIGVIPEKEMLDDDGRLDYDVVEEYLGNGIGHLTQVASQGLLDPEDAAETINEFQRYLVEETRLGIPALEHEECLTGYRGPGGTVFPQSIGLASTWSPALLESITDSIRTRLEAIGTAQALSPVLDVSRDMRWGRVEETYGEDPQLVATMAHAYVTGLQNDGDGIDATLKHFAAHGSGEGGKNRSSVQIGERELREVHLYPFEVAVQEADARAVMNAYHDIDGVPCASSEWLLTEVLRGEWDFEGHVVADYFSVDLLKAEHGIADTQREAGVAALEAGLDVELPATDCYGENLVAAVEEGELSEATVDTAVRRVLRAKIETGVFDDPFVDPEAATEPFDTDEQAELAARAAHESMTLLENDGLLPLSADDLDSVALVGPQADDGRGQVGDYTHAARFDSEEDGDFECVTPRDALEARGETAGFDVEYVEGATMTGPSADEFDAAEATVADADVAVACVGARSDIDFADRENPAELPDVPTSGEN